MFALCGDRDDALAVADAMVEAFERRKIGAHAIVSAVDRDGAQAESNRRAIRSAGSFGKPVTNAG